MCNCFLWFNDYLFTSTLFLIRTIFTRMPKKRLKTAQIFKNVLKTYPRLRKGEELLFWLLHNIMGINNLFPGYCSSESHHL